MKRYFVLALLFIFGGVITWGLHVYATEVNPDTNYTIDDMLVLALEDEWNAQVTYNAIIETYGDVKPFSKIVIAEGNHASLLIPLFEAYDVTIPSMPSVEDVTIPSSLKEAYALGVDAEIANIALYESFIEQGLPEDIEAVFKQLIFGSVHHLNAFEKALDRVDNVYDGFNEFKDQEHPETYKKGPQYKGGK